MMNGLPDPSRSTICAAHGVKSAAPSTSLLRLVHRLALPSAADAFVRSETFR